MIETGGVRRLKRSALVARHEDDDTFSKDISPKVNIIV